MSNELIAVIAVVLIGLAPFGYLSYSGQKIDSKSSKEKSQKKEDNENKKKDDLN